MNCVNSNFAIGQIMMGGRRPHRASQQTSKSNETVKSVKLPDGRKAGDK